MISLFGKKCDNTGILMNVADGGMFVDKEGIK